MKNETMKHTPGPWKVEIFTDCNTDEPAFGVVSSIYDKDWKYYPYIITEPGREPDCNWGTVSSNEYEANAKLIATAPKLLEALKKINIIHKADGYWLTIIGQASCQIRLSDFGPIVFRAISEWVDNRNAIISKAKGE